MTICLPKVWSYSLLAPEWTLSAQLACSHVLLRLREGHATRKVNRMTLTAPGGDLQHNRTSQSGFPWLNLSQSKPNVTTIISPVAARVPRDRAMNGRTFYKAVALGVWSASRAPLCQPQRQIHQHTPFKHPHHLFISAPKDTQSSFA